MACFCRTGGRCACACGAALERPKETDCKLNGGGAVATPECGPAIARGPSGLLPPESSIATTVSMISFAPPLISAFGSSTFRRRMASRARRSLTIISCWSRGKAKGIQPSTLTTTSRLRYWPLRPPAIPPPPAAAAAAAPADVRARPPKRRSAKPGTGVASRINTLLVFTRSWYTK